MLTGACLARTGFHRRVAYATAAMAVAAEFPDIDTIWSLRGPIAGFEHHRGITHTFLGVPFEAGILLLLVFLLYRSRKGPLAPSKSATARAARQGQPPVRWAALYGLLVLALLSHLLLDFTNNYGLRPFEPFDDRWYAGSIVFIFDPLLFVLLLAALVLPALFGLINRELGARRTRAHGGWAAAALAGVVLLWGIRTYEHGRAVALAQATVLGALARPSVEEGSEEEQGTQAPASGLQGLAPAVTVPFLQAQRSLASPDPLSVFRWYTVTDYGPAYRLGTADSRSGTLEPGRVLAKPEPSPTLTAAEGSHLGRVYLDWSPMPVLRVEQASAGSAGEFADAGAARSVLFADPRFMGDSPLLHRRGSTPLTGEVVLGANNAVIAEGMDGRFGR